MYDDDGLGSVLFLDLEHFLGDFVVRLIPADALPFAFAPFACATHRVLQPIGMVDRLGHIETAHAELSVGDGVEGVAFDFLQLVVFGVQQNAATHMAAGG